MKVKYTFLVTPTFIAEASFTKVTFSCKTQVKNMIEKCTCLGFVTSTLIAEASFTKVTFSSKNASKNNKYVS